MDKIVNNNNNIVNDNNNNNNHKDGSNRFSKILVAFDGSEPSMDAVNYAMKLGNKYNSHLILLHVIDNYKFPYLLSTVVLAPTYGSEKSVEERKKFEELMNSLKDKYLNSSDDVDIIESSDMNDTFSSTSKTKSFESDIVEAETSAAATIVDYAESKNVDMIVVGSRGRTGLKKMLVGSVASSVLKYAHCPVMVVR